MSEFGIGTALTDAHGRVFDVVGSFANRWVLQPRDFGEAERVSVATIAERFGVDAAGPDEREPFVPSALAVVADAQSGTTPEALAWQALADKHADDLEACRGYDED